MTRKRSDERLSGVAGGVHGKSTGTGVDKLTENTAFQCPNVIGGAG